LGDEQIFEEVEKAAPKPKGKKPEPPKPKAQWQLAHLIVEKLMQPVGVPQSTFFFWAEQVEMQVGYELAKAGLFPPHDYFEKRAAQLRYHEFIPEEQSQ
jgi:hypothetical protein